MSVVCDPASLINSAKCFAKCISPRDHIAVQNYLLSVILGGSTDPKVIVKAAACFLECIPPGFQQSVANYLLCQIINGNAAAVSAATDWANRVMANGGAMPSANTLSAVVTFYSALVAAGITGKYRTLNFVAPDSDIAARTPLIVGNGLGLYTGGGGGISINGYKAVGSSLRTGINPLTIYGNNVGAIGGWSTYIYSADNAIPQSITLNCLGCRVTATTSFCNYLPRNTVDFMSAKLWGTVAGSDIPNSPIVNPSAGYYSLNRSAINNLEFEHAQSGYPHAVVYNRVGNEGSSPPNAEFYFCGENKDSVDTVDNARTLSYMAFHDYLTPPQSLAEFNAVQALRISLGGGFV